jgi:sarcosine oxidase subunit gamma
MLERLGPLAAHQAISVTQLGPAARFSFRGGEAATTALGKAFGCVPRHEACRAAVDRDRAALWLGPDEWLLIAPESETASLFATLGEALIGEPHSLVDISHRNVGFDIMGEAAPAVLNAGCPLDFDPETFPTGMCTRTVLAKAEVVLWRLSTHRFRLEAWRSFAPYVLAFLTQAAENEER